MYALQNQNVERKIAKKIDLKNDTTIVPTTENKIINDEHIVPSESNIVAADSTLVTDIQMPLSSNSEPIGGDTTTLHDM
jgi:hypothetical protein